ncbi:MAG: urease accessory protein UreD [Myxococcota bacterium]
MSARLDLALPAADESGWEAVLELGFERVGGVTTLVRRRHRGPLRVQRPFHPDPAGPCQVIVLHPPGGVVGGDRLSLDVAVGERAEVLLTTPGASRFYRSLGATALQESNMRVARGGFLEWLPQETLVYDGAQVQLDTRVQLAPGARFLGWEITCLGLPASGRAFRNGSCHTRWEIWRDGVPLWIDRGQWLAGDERLEAAWGLAGHSVVASLVFVAPDADSLDVVRAQSAQSGFDGPVATTRLGEVVVCRALAHGTRPVLDLFSGVRTRLRRSILSGPASAPRIWAT